MINRAGFKIYCIEVENVLAYHPGVIECAIVGVPDPVLGERVKALIVPSDPHPSPDELRAFCAERLSDYKVPEIITFLAQPLPRNANGKVMKAELRSLAPN
jgi:acyl-CoA synthetase (AMP-forming)/AMP-acid ligase II